MEILFRRRRATVEEIRSGLPDPPSPSSVRKLLDILRQRGHVDREYTGPRLVYFPKWNHEEASRRALENVVRTFFGGSSGATIAALLEESDTQLEESEYKRLSGLLKRARSQRGDR